MTYNIRYANQTDGENSWSERKDFLADQLKFYSPDVFGIQEGLSNQLNYLDSSLVAYKYIGVGRDDGKTKGEHSAIFYNFKRVKLISSSTFWLSDTPEKVSVGWDAAMERICTYALFETANTGQKFFVFNTHFDHVGHKARENSAKLILEKIAQINKEDFPVMVCGDFNLEPEKYPIELMKDRLNDSKMVAEEVCFGPDGTYNAYRFHEAVTRRIDYIFTDKDKIKIDKYAVLSDSRNCLYPSDHLPVFIELEFVSK